MHSFISLDSRAKHEATLRQLLSHQHTNFTPILLSGPISSGKSFLIKSISQIIHGTQAAPFLTQIQLSNDTDAKTLVGAYTSSDKPGHFIWKAGTLTNAVQNGYILLIEDIEQAPSDVISLLLYLIDHSEVALPFEKIKIHENFKLILTTRLELSQINVRLLKRCYKVPLGQLINDEINQILGHNFKNLENYNHKLLEICDFLKEEISKKMLFKGPFF